MTLTPLERTIDSGGLHYRYVDVEFNRAARTATISVRGPGVAPQSVDDALTAGAGWWPLQMARELDDAILSMRTNELELGLWLFKAAGDPEAVVAMDRFILDHQDHWFVREVLGMMPDDDREQFLENLERVATACRESLGRTKNR